MCKLLIVLLQSFLITEQDTTTVVQRFITSEEYSLSNIERLISGLVDKGLQLGWLVVKALLIFFVGRFFIRLVTKLLRKVLVRRKVNASVRTFLGSMINVLLTVLLIISVIGALGIQTTSFAALLASVGVAIGVALSGNLSNFAGGLLILLFKPFKVGDYIETSNCSGTVKEIQIFHTVVHTSDNRVVYVPNGSLSSGVITNVNLQPTRRVEWIFGVDYGTDYEKVKALLLDLLEKDDRILKEYTPFIVLKQLDNSSVNIMVRVWVNTSDYWGVFFDTNRKVYEMFNKEQIVFPFPQLTVHQAVPEKE